MALSGREIQLLTVYHLPVIHIKEDISESLLEKIIRVVSRAK